MRVRRLIYTRERAGETENRECAGARGRCALRKSKKKTSVFGVSVVRHEKKKDKAKYRE